jgi:hypothetical protein
LGDEPFRTYIEKRLPRTDDKGLFQELMKVFEESGKDGLRKHLQNLVSQLEEG